MRSLRPFILMLASACGGSGPETPRATPPPMSVEELIDVAAEAECARLAHGDDVTKSDFHRDGALRSRGLTLADYARAAEAHAGDATVASVIEARVAGCRRDSGWIARPGSLWEKLPEPAADR